MVPVIGGCDTDSDGVSDGLAAVPYVRDVRARRLRSAERKLFDSGRVNPLALDEYAALEERHTFLTGQLEDLKNSKRDLMDIVREIDRRRVEKGLPAGLSRYGNPVQGVFSRLFPRGERLEVLPRPRRHADQRDRDRGSSAGKKIKRLSLLSGGERSLVASSTACRHLQGPTPARSTSWTRLRPPLMNDANLGRS